MTNEYDNLEFQIIDYALKSNNQTIINIMNKLLEKYSINIELLIINTLKYLNEITPYFWKVEKGSNNKQSFTLKCSNLDECYKNNKQKTNNNKENIYYENHNNNISYNELFNINIYTTSFSKINAEFIKAALIHTYKEMLSKKSTNIIKEFYDIILPLQITNEEKLQEIEQTIIRNRNETISINKKNIETKKLQDKYIEISKLISEIIGFKNIMEITKVLQKKEVS